MRRREFLSGQAAETAGKLAAALEDRGDTIDRFIDLHDLVSCCLYLEEHAYPPASRW